MKSFKAFMETVQSGEVVIDTLLKTRQLAELFNVSVSTIKRWVDLGELPATRTVGGHRLIPLSGALRFAEAQGLPTAGLRRLAARQEAEAEVTAGPDELTWQALANNLKRGRAAAARHLIKLAYAIHHDAAAMADDLIRPAMESIGHDWERQSLDVYQEHRASRIVETTVMELIQAQAPPRAESPLAIGAAAAGDLYTLPGLFCELTLRELGWDVVNLGPNLPMTSLAKAARVQQPRLVWLSVSSLGDVDQFVDEYKNFYASVSRTGAAVVLGGSALTPAVRACLVAASFGDRMRHLKAFARGLHPDPAGPNPDRSTDRPAADLP